MRGLIQVHEVHVHGGPGERLVELGVQVQDGFGERLQTGNPHLGRREGVHPEHQTDAILGVVGFAAERANGVRRGHHRLEDHAHRDRFLGIEIGGDLLRVDGDLRQGLFSVEVLTARDEPDFQILDMFHLFSLSLLHSSFPARLQGYYACELSGLPPVRSPVIA